MDSRQPERIRDQEAAPPHRLKLNDEWFMHSHEKQQTNHTRDSLQQTNKTMLLAADTRGSASATKLDVRDYELTYDRNRSWLMSPGTGLCTLSMLSSACNSGAPLLRNGLVASVAIGLGFASVLKDSRNLYDSQNDLATGKFRAALVTDAAMMASGVAMLARVGPRWLGPSLIVGSGLARLAIDFIPDEMHRK